jgi:4-amino-4-deoxy-L-arabinose transferase-like glycosyltransferase
MMSRTEAPPTANGHADERTLGNAVLLLLAIAAVRVVHLLFFYPVDLYPDEAQYWAWAQSLDFGYFSKPPLIAWAIAATTAVCGNAEGCVRLSSPLFQLGASLFVLGVGRRLFSPWVGVWAGVVFATLPGVSVSSAVASTDAPLLFFWGAALYALVRLLEKPEPRWWALLGAAVGLGMLAKYAMGFFVLSVALLILVDGAARKALLSRGGLVAAVLAVLVFAPNVVWNARHRFVTLAHTEANANIGASLFHPVALAEFLLSQLGVFGPILFVALIWIVIARKHLLARNPHRLLALFAAPPLLLMIALSILSRANANWAAPTYIAGTVLVVAVLLAERRPRLLTISVALHAGVAILAFAVAGWAVARPDALPGWADPLKRLRSWHSFATAVDRVSASVVHRGYLFEDRPELAELLYYGRPQPVEAWKWNPSGVIHDHFDLTRNVASAPPGPLVLVTSATDPSYILTHFAHAEPIGDVRQVLGRNRQRAVRLYLVDGFKGYDR